MDSDQKQPGLSAERQHRAGLKIYGKQAPIALAPACSDDLAAELNEALAPGEAPGGPCVGPCPWYERVLRHWRLWFFIILIAAATIIYRTTHLHSYLSLTGIHQLRTSILQAGPSGAALFVAIYVATVTLGLPNLPLQLAAGLIYGVWPAFVLMYIGVNIGASTAFWLARTLGRRAIEDIWGHRLASINKRVEHGGFRFVLILRLIPLMPFNGINYGSGISRIRFRKYLVATVIGTPILTFLHVAVGSAAGAIDFSHPKPWTHPDVYIPLAIAAVGLIVTFTLRPLSKAATKLLQKPGKN